MKKEELSKGKKFNEQINQPTCGQCGKFANVKLFKQSFVCTDRKNKAHGRYKVITAKTPACRHFI